MSGNKSEAGSIVEKILNDRLNEDKRKAILEEEIAEYKSALNGMAATPNGQYFLKKLIRYCGVYSYDHKIDPAMLVEKAALRKVYLELIRPFLEIETRNTLEQ